MRQSLFLRPMKRRPNPGCDREVTPLTVCAIKKWARMGLTANQHLVCGINPLTFFRRTLKGLATQMRAHAWD